MTNPSFESGTASWQLSKDGTTGVITQSSEWSTNGTYSAKVYSGLDVNDQWEMLYQGSLVWNASDRLTLSYDLNVTKACSVVTGIGDWNNNVLTLYTTNTTRLSPGVYSSNTFTTVATNTAKGTGMVYIILSSNPVNTTMYVDSAILTDGTTPTVTPTPTPTATPTATASPTATPTPTASPTASPTATPTVTPTVTPTPTASPTATPTASPTATPTPSPTVTPTPTASPTATPTPSPTVTPTPTASPTATPTPPSPTAHPTATPTVGRPNLVPVVVNLLTNPSFESGTAPWKLSKDGTTGVITQSSESSTNGKYSAKLFSGSDVNDQWEMLYQGSLVWNASDRLTLSYDLNVTKACSVVTKIGDWNNNVLTLYTTNTARLSPGVYRSNTISTVATNTAKGTGMVYIILTWNIINTTMYVDNTTLTDTP